MTIGAVPIRERLILPRRGAGLSHVLEGDTTFPTGTTATLYLYDGDDTELGFWPLTVSGADITIDIDSEDLVAVPNHCFFTVFVTYPAGKKLPWFEGASLRMSR
jgi:hypothetical protein